MGLRVRINLHAADERHARHASSSAFGRIASLDGMMSDYRPDSELRRLEGEAGQWSRISPELFDVIARAIGVSRATDGAFDISVGPLVELWRQARRTGHLPDSQQIAQAHAHVGWRRIEMDANRRAIRLPRGTRLDLGGIAKGYILQQALLTLNAAGVTSALVEAGGDIVVGQAPPGREGWRIDTSALDPAFRARAERLTNAALATSGPTGQSVEIDGLRYSHVIDPRTGVGLTDGHVARVIARDAATADALATALTVLGPERAAGIRRRFPDAIVSIEPEPAGWR
jgi:thiamine biosynthesis lipoprotein